MKAVAITSLAFVASVQAAGWQDADPAKSTTTTKPVELTSTWDDAVISTTTSTTTTKPAEETQSYWGDEEVVESTTTCTYEPEETPSGGEGEDDEHVWSETVIETTTVWSDVPSVETKTTVWSDVPAPSKSVSGGGDEHVWSDAGDDYTTTTATGTVTETKWIDVSPSSPVAPVDGGKTWEEVPAVPTDVSPASSSSWADYVASTPAADSCVVSVITKYGKPTWTPESDAPATWSDLPTLPSSVAESWSDLPAAPSSSSVAQSWSDVPAVPTTTAPAVHTWSDVSDCGVPSTVYEEVTITYTVTESAWENVVISTTSPSVETATYVWADSEPSDVPSSDSDKPVHGGHGGKPKPTTTTTTTTTPAVETKTWSDFEFSSTTTTVPTKETTTTWSKPVKETTTSKDIPTTTKPTSGEETTQAYWGDAQ